MLDVTLLLVRVILGIFFIAHGYGKLKDSKDMANWLESINYTPGIFWAWVLILTEFFGGVLLFLGLGTRIIAGLMSVVLILGIVHRVFKKKLSFCDGWDLNLVALGNVIVLILLGSGKFSLEFWIV